MTFSNKILCDHGYDSKIFESAWSQKVFNKFEFMKDLFKFFYISFPYQNNTEDKNLQLQFWNILLVRGMECEHDLNLFITSTWVCYMEFNQNPWENIIWFFVCLADLVINLTKRLCIIHRILPKGMHFKWIS